MTKSTSIGAASFRRRSLFVFVAFGLTAALLAVACGGKTSASNDTKTLEQQAWSQIEKGAILLDVRTSAEYKAGHLEGAINIPHDQLRARIAELGSDKSKDVVVYCRTGRRAGLILPVLKEYGFENVLNAKSYQRMIDAKPGAQSGAAGE